VTYLVLENDVQSVNKTGNKTYGEKINQHWITGVSKKCEGDWTDEDSAGHWGELVCLGVASDMTAMCGSHVIGWVLDLPRIVRGMLINRSIPQPRSRKTPRGGRMMAKMILQISL
jgi:hypothetical protein